MGELHSWQAQPKQVIRSAGEFDRLCRTRYGTPDFFFFGRIQSLYKRGRCGGTEWQPACVAAQCSRTIVHIRGWYVFSVPKASFRGKWSPAQYHWHTWGEGERNSSLLHTGQHWKILVWHVSFLRTRGSNCRLRCRLQRLPLPHICKSVGNILRSDTTSYYVPFGFYRTQTKRGSTKVQLNML